jgi:hypothetical protein
VHGFFRRNFFNRLQVFVNKFLIKKKIELNTASQHNRFFKNKFNKFEKFLISEQLRKHDVYFRSIKRLKYKDYHTDTGFGVSSSL